jgi:Transcription factor Tfb2
LSTLPSANPSDTSSQGYIILETNYRLYAYTNSPLQIAILNLFVSLKSRFENLVQGIITRDSVRNALNNGISADQIIYFISSNVHPQMRTNVPFPGECADTDSVVTPHGDGSDSAVGDGEESPGGNAGVPIPGL